MTNTDTSKPSPRTLVRSHPLVLILAAGLTIGCTELTPVPDHVERPLTTEEADQIMASAELIEASVPTTRINKTSLGIEKVSTMDLDVVLPGGDLVMMTTSCKVTCFGGCSPSGCDVSSHGNKTICTTSSCIGTNCGQVSCEKLNTKSNTAIQ